LGSAIIYFQEYYTYLFFRSPIIFVNKGQKAPCAFFYSISFFFLYTLLPRILFAGELTVCCFLVLSVAITRDRWTNTLHHTSIIMCNNIMNVVCVCVCWDKSAYALFNLPFFLSVASRPAESKNIQIWK